MIVIGLMSGTSADGIDVAIVEVAGTAPQLDWHLLHHTTIPHPDTLRAEILACCDLRTASVDRISRLNTALGKAFGQAVLAGVAACGMTPSQIDLIGSHGQTIWHAPHGSPPNTLQIAAAAEIAELTGAPVVSDFRSRDIAVGGEGAPLVPAVDLLLFSHPTKIRVLQNIGGIGNMTYIAPGGGHVLAFDTGPGNILLDQAMRMLSGGRESFDLGGRLAAQGRVHGELLEELLEHPFLQRTPPKSTGREEFSATFSEHIHGRAHTLGLTHPDLLTTLTAFTAQSIAYACHTFLPSLPDEVIVSGGGTRNATLMHMLQESLAPTTVYTSADFGIPPEAKEALAFALLAYETWHGRPGNLPAATGASRQVVLGSITGGWGHVNPSQGPTPAWVNVSTDGVPLTEIRNPLTEQIDTFPTHEILAIMNREDARVAEAVAHELPQIAAAVEAIAERMQRGGRLIYAGAGTSGRLGALDAAECPPTFNTPPELVVALMAGGQHAFGQAIEGAEDDAAAGIRAIESLPIQAADTLVGIAASGSTPYVVGALQAAQQAGALTVSLACSQAAAIAQHAQIAITPLVGPEIITGSTRLKAGTAQKMVLNMLTTGVMIKLGKTYGNLMVDVQPTNSKLRRRALRIVCQATGLPEEEAALILAACNNHVKTAIVAALTDLPPHEAAQRLARSGGRVREALRH